MHCQVARGGEVKEAHWADEYVVHRGKLINIDGSGCNLPPEGEILVPRSRLSRDRLTDRKTIDWLLTKLQEEIERNSKLTDVLSNRDV